MADFPLFINMEGRKVIVIGGGAVALRKIRILKEYGADIQVISSKILDDLKLLADNENLGWFSENMAEYKLACLNEAFLVICASDNEAVNRMAAAHCRKHHILVDCAKPGEEVQELINIFQSFISDAISNFNSDLYYQNPDYLEWSYREGELLD